MRRILAAAALTAAIGLAGAAPVWAGAGNPNGTGPPSQSCQNVVLGGGTEPGHASTSPGSPFNEPSGNNPGGTGGLNYSPSSQYDVACYHVSNR